MIIFKLSFIRFIVDERSYVHRWWCQAQKKVLSILLSPICEHENYFLIKIKYYQPLTVAIYGRCFLIKSRGTLVSFVD